MGMGQMPEMYQMVINSNHEMIVDLVGRTEPKQKKMAKQAADLALLSQGLLTGEALTEFINRSYNLIK